jgi:vancomycin permeability regulator SanA
MKNIVIVLGSPNSPTGELGDLSLERLNCCKALYKKGDLILCTGGWGTHFNTSSYSHASLAKSYLVAKGISEEVFLKFALSQNTVDDAVKVKETLKTIENCNLTIITSDFHLERVTLIFNEILKDYKLKFIGAKSSMDIETYNRVVAHEKKAVQSIIKNGLYY